MCKNLIKSLIGAPSAEVSRTAAPTTNVSTNSSTAEVKNTDLVEAQSGREASGRVKLSGSTRRGGSVPGLSL